MSITLRDGVYFRKIGDEGIAYDPAGRKVHVLNATACSVWNMCAQGQTIEEMAQQMSALFNVPLQQVTEDIVSVLDSFAGLGLIQK